MNLKLERKVQPGKPLSCDFHGMEAHLNFNKLAMNNISKILESGKFESFIGLREDEYFEAKGAVPYDLDSPIGRFELAKDTSAFANAGGGHIVIGLAHTKLDTENTEEITKLELIEEKQFDRIKIVGIITSHIYPKIKGLDVYWRASTANPKMGVGCIYVPPQYEDDKYFLITKVAEDGIALKENVCGIARRDGAHNVPFRAQDLARLIKEGRSTSAQRMTRIEDKVDKLLSKQSRKNFESLEKTFESRIKRLSGEDK